jgi:hypothetical protein
VADSIEVEFKLSAHEVENFASRGIGRVAFRATMILLVGVLAQIEGYAFHNDVLISAGFVLLFVSTMNVQHLSRLPKYRRFVTARLAGATRMVLSDYGIEYAGEKLAEQVAWTHVPRLADRPDVWVVYVGTPMSFFFIPKAAVSPQQRVEFVSQLMAWSGGAYKAYKR